MELRRFVNGILQGIWISRAVGVASQVPGWAASRVEGWEFDPRIVSRDREKFGFISAGAPLRSVSG